MTRHPAQTELTQPAGGQRLRVVLFDLDGTLLDTAPEFASVLNQLLATAGRVQLPPPRIHERVSDGVRALVQLGFELSPEEDGFAERHRDLLRAYQQGLGQRTQPFDGIEALLAELGHRQMNWGVVTNKPVGLSTPLLQIMGMAPDCLVCSDQLEHPKPHPGGLLRACQELDCPAAQALYVGDHRRDIEAAHNAGMRAAAVSWGYAHSDDPPSAWGADYLLRTPLELLELLPPVGR